MFSYQTDTFRLLAEETRPVMKHIYASTDNDDDNMTTDDAPSVSRMPQVIPITEQFSLAPSWDATPTTPMAKQPPLFSSERAFHFQDQSTYAPLPADQFKTPRNDARTRFNSKYDFDGILS